MLEQSERFALQRLNEKSTMSNSHISTGASGRRYDDQICDFASAWRDAPGNYIFAKQTPAGWVALYIGQTCSFQDRIPSHERWAIARQHGAAHVHAHINHSGERIRQAEEADLVRLHIPRCNRILTAAY
jgi:hypothetical protein